MRVAFRDSLGVAKITQANSYGIFGEDLTTLNYLKSTWKKDFFKFTGKEELQGTGYIDFGARLYDPIVPRFTTLDPLAELSRRFSPTVYGNNNPIRFIDPDGMKSKDYTSPSGYYKSDLGAGGEQDNEDEKPKKKQTEEQRLSEIVTINGNQYHKNTTNIFALIGNKINSLFGGDPNYFVDKKPYDAVEDKAVHAFFDNGVAVIAGGVAGKVIGQIAGGVATTEGAISIEEGIQASESVVKGFTGHATQQAINRGFKSSDILKIVREGTPVEAMGRYGSQIRFTLGGNTVVVNAQGKIVTLFSDVQGTANGLGKGFLKPLK